MANKTIGKDHEPSIDSTLDCCGHFLAMRRECRVITLVMKTDSIDMAVRAPRGIERNRVSNAEKVNSVVRLELDGRCHLACV